MANKAKIKKVVSDEVPTPETLSEVSGEQNDNNESPRYVVVRGGMRVSDKDYPNANEPKALEEQSFWKRVVSRFPDGTKIEIVPFDKKQHRIW